MHEDEGLLNWPFFSCGKFVRKSPFREASSFDTMILHFDPKTNPLGIIARFNPVGTPKYSSFGTPHRLKTWKENWQLNAEGSKALWDSPPSTKAQGFQSLYFRIRLPPKINWNGSIEGDYSIKENDLKILPKFVWPSDGSSKGSIFKVQIISALLLLFPRRWQWSAPAHRPLQNQAV